MGEDEVRQAAKEMAKVGASKGGKARASVLTPEERKEVAQKAARARWGTQESAEENAEAASIPVPRTLLSSSSSTGGDMPVSLFQGTLTLGDVEFPCHVLSDGKRVLAQREVSGLISGGRKGSLTKYLTSSAMSKYIDADEIVAKSVHFAIPGTHLKANGYDATLVIEICDAYLRARADGALTRAQIPLARRAEVIIRSCAKIGIIALIDEVTGYQQVRERNALQLKLQAFIADEMQEWARMFPEEFWLELARLENVRYSPRSRPLRWGKYVMAFVYDAVDKDVGRELRERNPKPQHGRNHHQLLKQFGRDKVRDHLNQVLGVMKLCRDMKDFQMKFAHVFKKNPLQASFLDLFDDFRLS